MALLRILENLSLGLTIVNIIMCVAVVVLWFKAAREALKRGPLDAQNWFILGVFFGFVGESLDNVYWLLPWTADYLGLSSADTLMRLGFLPNIPFRQLLGALAAYCHVRAHFQFKDNKDRRHNSILHVAVVAGLAYSVALILVS